ncbi:unnamed protein product [Kuraishia capsulata CBS 1993]|uniref:LNS2/PITP domain-containing protein n=1 Tax=Kuraishia capsulata CBS 1993 TaxID=1382522 RepID=W6MGB8_9ASCO|nr:uncharacterized protein KUCA_T00000798001 [Kuraishia capsulata CBS 1993]CDK24831.1 unnamed protein product [Kuraishia capsulata CBS 1993]
MQYVGRAIGSVSKTWSSINPATLSGAIDVIVVEQDNGDLACSPFHVRFGKFQLLRPSQKKVDFIVNGEKTNLPMKLGDGGEAFFVFETEAEVPSELQTSPVISPVSSPSSLGSPSRPSTSSPLQEPEFLDIGEGITDDGAIEKPAIYTSPPSDQSSAAPSSPIPHRLTSEKMHEISKKLITKNIPSRVDANGNIEFDMMGYKSNDQTAEESEAHLRQLLKDELGDSFDLNSQIARDLHGNLILNSTDELAADFTDSVSTLGTSPPEYPTSMSSANSITSTVSDLNTDTPEGLTGLNHFKTLRLTSEQLKCLGLKKGENEIKFAVNSGKSVISARLFFWKYDVPIVISDIDGTITKSDALGHVLTILGRDWTHAGVAKLFKDIQMNGYNIMYLTSRSVGQADSTRYYLQGVIQDGIQLPPGPVILSPDRTLAAIRREMVLKRPEVFKMACLHDIKLLYESSDKESMETPFYAGFGNRITDALSYRSVGVPSSKIFTINPDGEVHMELLEMAGYKSSYVNIGELVDYFFPPARASGYTQTVAGSKVISNHDQYTDLNFWREPVPEISDLEDDNLSVDSEEAALRQKKQEQSEIKSPKFVNPTLKYPSPEALDPTAETADSSYVDQLDDEDDYDEDDEDYDYTDSEEGDYDDDGEEEEDEEAEANGDDDDASEEEVDGDDIDDDLKHIDESYAVEQNSTNGLMIHNKKRSSSSVSGSSDFQASGDFIRASAMLKNLKIEEAD